jgi:hypothetical protein
MATPFFGEQAQSVVPEFQLVNTENSVLEVEPNTRMSEGVFVDTYGLILLFRDLAILITPCPCNSSPCRSL